MYLCNSITPKKYMKTKIKTFIRILVCLLIGLFILIQISCTKENPVTPIPPISFSLTDYDGNVYDTIRIGTQVWMKQNLKTTHFRNGEPIDHISLVDWHNAFSSAYCDYEDDTAISRTYGKLYNYHAAVDSRGICPPGWHVPSDAEWQTLIAFLHGPAIAGSYLKEKGTVHWTTPNTNANDVFGFTALPAGIADVTYQHNWGTWGCFMTTYRSFMSIYYYCMYYDSERISKLSGDLRLGLSIRCIMN